MSKAVIAKANLMGHAMTWLTETACHLWRGNQTTSTLNYPKHD